MGTLAAGASLARRATIAVAADEVAAVVTRGPNTAASTTDLLGDAALAGACGLDRGWWAADGGVMSRRALTALVASALLVLAACNPDPTGGARPPSSGPAFTSGIWSVARDDLPYSWREGCPVSWQDLSAVNVAYWGYDGERHTGNLVVHDSVATDVVKVFRRIYEVRFQIRRIHPVDVYQGSDSKSMAANNTSAFNCRTVAGSSSWSEHAYGKAIDINPVQNPYVKGSTVDPPAGRDWTDRSHQVPGMIAHGDAVWGAWAYIGWEWGGDWNSSKDYQHFSLSGR